MRRVLCLIFVALTVAVAGCSGSTSDKQIADPQAELQRVVGAIQRGGKDVDVAAAMTTEPGSAGQFISTVLNDMHPRDLQLTGGKWQRPEPNKATIDITWRWLIEGAGAWEYTTIWHWERRGEGSKARWWLLWSPTVIHPQLGEQQTLVLRTVPTESGVLVDRANRQISGPTKVYIVHFQPENAPDQAASIAALAATLAPFDASITVESITAGIAKAEKGAGYTVVNLRDTDFDQVQGKLAGIAGVKIRDEVRNLAPTKDFARPILDGVQKATQGNMAGTKGWRITAVDATGAEVTTLAEKEPVAGAKAMLTIDLDIQSAAEAALATVERPAALVAIQASTGELLAVAQNAAANAEGTISLTGRYPPGSTFKIVTAAAAMQAGLVNPDSPVECPGTWRIHSRAVNNYEKFDLGSVDLRTAFARSCNTTFAQLAAQMGPDALTKAAEQFGIGVDFVVPGITTLTGKVPASTNEVQRAENGFGQGKVLASVFSEALMAATASAGSMPMPTLIRGQTTTADKKVPPLTAQAHAGLKDVMRTVVSGGTAAVLAQDGEVYAKTGEAEYTDPKTKETGSHAWTAAFRGDIAFAVLIVGGGSSSNSNVVAHQFLSAIGQSPAG